MRKLVLVLVAAGLFGAMPAFASEHEGMKMESKDGMKECVLVVDTIQEKIKKLESEVAKGEKKYNAKEMKKLKRKLDEANKMLNQMYGP